MLIDLLYLYQKYNLKIKGILHIGAHECEEMSFYLSCGLDYDSVLWIEGQKNICDKVKQENSLIRIYNEVISDTDDDVVEFIITNNFQSSSILELEEHKLFHPSITEINRYKVKTKTIDTFFKEHGEDTTKYNMVNIDIQGAELLALKGMKKFLPYVDYLYLEVNKSYLYKNCALIDEIDSFLSLFSFKRVETKFTDCNWGDAFYMKF